VCAVRFASNARRQARQRGGLLWSLSLCALWLAFSDGRVVWSANDFPAVPTGSHTALPSMRASETTPEVVLLALGDSLTHGTMDATNNAINTVQAYLQRIADALGQVLPLTFSQPLFTLDEERIRPFHVPTNLGVDGADAFSLEGIEYYKRAGVDESFVTEAYLCDKLLPPFLEDTYDKVLYPINLLARQAVSQLDAAVWHLKHLAASGGRAVVVFWVGNNDSSTAALGSGGQNPTYLPMPFELVEPELTPALRLVLRAAQQQGALSFAPYTMAAIERHLTELQDFANQYEHLLARLETESQLAAGQLALFLLTLPYYSAVGYLFDSDDLEYYLRKLNPTYTVPPTFKRVAPQGEPIADPLAGDRVSLLTFGLMYALLSSGYSTDYVNRALEIDGQQHDDLVLSEDEQGVIRARIDGFNATIAAAAAARGPHVHLIEIGQHLNDVLTGVTPIVIDGRAFSRKWMRGSSFTFDGVHPGYTAQTFIANFVLARLNEALGLAAPLYDLSAILATDPYVDRDGDGWAPGPGYTAAGLTELLFLFKDPNDSDAAIQPILPPDVWQRISQILLREILGISSVQQAAERLGVDSAR
jgi:lysophospholipase L1-like esterase